MREGTTVEQLAGSLDFKTTTGRLQCFKSGHIRELAIQGKKLLTDQEATTLFNHLKNWLTWRAMKKMKIYIDDEIGLN